MTYKIFIYSQTRLYYKGKMAHNNTQQMEFYDNTSVNHSINVKQSNDVHFICDSNDRRKLKIIISGLYMWQFSMDTNRLKTHIYNWILISRFTNCIYNIGLFIVTLWLRSSDTIRTRKKKSCSLWFQKKFSSYYAFLRLLWPTTRNIWGNLHWQEFSLFYTSKHNIVHLQLERTLTLSCGD